MICTCPNCSTDLAFREGPVITDIVCPDCKHQFSPKRRDWVSEASETLKATWELDCKDKALEELLDGKNEVSEYDNPDDIWTGLRGDFKIMDINSHNDPCLERAASKILVDAGFDPWPRSERKNSTLNKYRKVRLAPDVPTHMKPCKCGAPILIKSKQCKACFLKRGKSK